MVPPLKMVLEMNHKKMKNTFLWGGYIYIYTGVKSDCQPQSGTPVNSPTTTFTEDGVLGLWTREVRLAKGGWAPLDRRGRGHELQPLANSWLARWGKWRWLHRFAI